MQIINVNKESHKVFTVEYSVYFTDVCYPDTIGAFEGAFDIVVDMNSSETMDDIETQCFEFIEKSYPRALSVQIDSINECLIIEKKNVKRAARYTEWKMDIKQGL